MPHERYERRKKATTIPHQCTIKKNTNQWLYAYKQTEAKIHEALVTFLPP